MKERIEINSAAISLRREFGIDVYSPVDILSLIQNSDDLTIVFYPMGERVSGICIRDEKNKIIAVNSNTTYGRQRFTIAHELYHLYYHKTFKRIVCSKDLEREKDPMETEADMFASYFLAPYEALREFIKNRLRKAHDALEIADVVRIEQHFGLSRQAALWRLINEDSLTLEKADTMKHGIISSALKLGYDEHLYQPSPEGKKYATFGKYIKLAEELKEKDLISTGKYEELLLNGFRGDMVYDHGGEDHYD